MMGGTPDTHQNPATPRSKRGPDEFPEPKAVLVSGEAGYPRKPQRRRLALIRNAFLFVVGSGHNPQSREGEMADEFPTKITYTLIPVEGREEDMLRELAKL